ncbi:MAG: hypothetical protein ACPGYT_05455 [Nitrospirales bacterium]
MNVSGIEQGSGPLSQVANALSSSSKPSTLVQRQEDKEENSKSALQTGPTDQQGVQVEISRAAKALSESQLSSQQGSQQETPSPLDKG